MRRALTASFALLAVLSIGAAVYALFQPNPSGDFISGMAQLFLAMSAAAGAVFCAILAAVLRFSSLKTGWVLVGAAFVVAIAFGAALYL